MKPDTMCMFAYTTCICVCNPRRKKWPKNLVLNMRKARLHPSLVWHLCWTFKKMYVFFLLLDLVSWQCCGCWSIFLSRCWRQSPFFLVRKNQGLAHRMVLRTAVKSRTRFLTTSGLLTGTRGGRSSEAYRDWEAWGWISALPSPGILRICDERGSLDGWTLYLVCWTISCIFFLFQKIFLVHNIRITHPKLVKSYGIGYYGTKPCIMF